MRIVRGGGEPAKVASVNAVSAMRGVVCRDAISLSMY